MRSIHKKYKYKRLQYDAAIDDSASTVFHLGCTNPYGGQILENWLDGWCGDFAADIGDGQTHYWEQGRWYYEAWE